jgi:hypothetical protein
VSLLARNVTVGDRIKLNDKGEHAGDGPGRYCRINEVRRDPKADTVVIRAKHGETMRVVTATLREPLEIRH